MLRQGHEQPALARLVNPQRRESRSSPLPHAPPRRRRDSRAGRESRRTRAVTPRRAPARAATATGTARGAAASIPACHAHGPAWACPSTELSPCPRPGRGHGRRRASIRLGNARAARASRRRRRHARRVERMHQPLPQFAQHAQRNHRPADDVRLQLAQLVRRAAESRKLLARAAPRSPACFRAASGTWSLAIVDARAVGRRRAAP